MIVAFLAPVNKRRERPEQDANPALCNTGALLYQSSYEASWELVVRCVEEKAIDDVYRSMYMMLVHKIHLLTFTAD